MTVEILVPALLVAVATIFGVLTLVLFWEVLREGLRRFQARRRLRALTRSGGGGVQKALLRDAEDRDGVLARMGRGIPGVVPSRELIRQSGVDMGVESFAAMSTAFALGFGAAALLLWGSLIATVLAAIAGALIPYGWLVRKRNLRARAFEESFPEAIDLLTRAIRAGHPISAGMRMIGNEGPEGVAQEFRMAAEEQRFGLPFEDSLLNMVERTDGVDVRIFATALLVQRDVGGNLAEILDNLAETIRGRFYIRRQLRVYTAQGRMTGWILGLLPIFVGGIIWLIDPTYMGTLLDNSGGIALLVSAAILQLIGVFWISRIVDIDI